MWSKADVVGVNSSSTTPKMTASKPSESAAVITVPTPSRNGKHVKSEAVVKSESEEEEESQAGNESEESRFTDSEDDR